MKQAFFSVTLVVSICMSAFATPQAPDEIIYQSFNYPLLANPLESYYSQNRNIVRPNFWVMPGVRSTGNWRGYVAKWEIDSGRLYLVKIDGWICASALIDDCRPVEIANLFGAKYGKGRIAADWYSGELRLAKGEVVRSVWVGYESVFAYEIILTIESGRLTAVRHIDNTKRNFYLEDQRKLEQQRKDQSKEKVPR